ncbi:hypothetical protein SteCoe_19285 [Stentor coeruleus]|uniref:USP domain-containing protein n=1 Tax=Stentor coeruleus TaxID=5963 RepID=A0A1R2BUG0_9CILI|nr:hypothetical protein SteCoe_19285 [Stentor coeruleus]
MQDISSSLVETASTEELITHLKRPRSPSEETITYKAPQDSVEKRAFYSRQGPGVVKTIWIIRDIEELINSSSFESQIESEWFEAANGSKWRITLCLQSEKSHFSIFLETNTQTNTFPQDATYTIIAHILKPAGKIEKIMNKTSKDTFTAEHPMIGYPKSIPCSKFTSYPEKLLFITCTVKTTANREICKKVTGFVGLINEGTTCYMNSLLQTLFLITSFRKAIYSIPVSDSEDCKIPKALAKLFAALQLSEKPLSTQALLKSFGWARRQWHEQQDVQEFSYKFSDTLEKSMNGTPAAGTYAQLFKGQTIQSIKCINVDHVSEKSEDFIDLQLDVKGCANIYASLEKYIEPVPLKGEMQYEAEGHGKQDAMKFVRFNKLPSVLQIQLKRFEYNQTRGMMTKVNEKFEFYPEVDLNPYVVNQGEHNKYRLFSIMVHSGTLGKGHYSSYISPRLDNEWYQFNDDTVDKALPKQAIEVNWGGEIEDICLIDGGTVVQGKKKCDTSAYMLVYIRIEEKNTILPEISDSAIPPKLIQPENISETKPRDTRRITRTSSCNIAFASKETIFGWDGPGITHYTSKKSFFIYQARKNSKIQDFIDTKLAYLADAKLWVFNPKPVSWTFQEINSSELLSSYAVNEDITVGIFIDTKEKIFTGSPDNWSLNEQEFSSINDRQDSEKILVIIKKCEHMKTSVVGTEWICDNNILELRKKLFQKYFEHEHEGWICLEKSSSKEVRIEELYAFLPMKKNGKFKLVENGDALIIGYEAIDVGRVISEKYRNITVEAVYYDSLTFFEFKSYSKSLYDKHQLPTNFQINIDLSCTLTNLMNAIVNALNVPEVDRKSIQILSQTYRPVTDKDFFLSNILNHNKFYFDILKHERLDSLKYVPIIAFLHDFTPCRSFFIETNQENTIDDLLKKLGENNELFLFKYQQRAILRFLSPEESLNELNPGVIYGIREGKDSIGKKEKKILGFHAFGIEQGKDKPFSIIVERSESCADVKRKIVDKFNCSAEAIKVVKLDNEENPSCFKLFSDLEESTEQFWSKYKNCSLMVEHKYQGMRFN